MPQAPELWPVRQELPVPQRQPEPVPPAGPLRLLEPLGAPNPDPLGLPDAMFVRPTVLLVFDRLADALFLVAPVWPDEARDTAAIVANTSELLPEPETPVNTVSRRFGISMLTSNSMECPHR